MIKVMSIFGTRPEAIKMAVVVKELEKRENVKSVVCLTAQHREMLDQVMEIFNIKADYDLNIMKKGQTLTEITSKILHKLDKILKEEKPDIVLVHGDTSTTFAAALSAFYNGIKVGHVEAGLRSFDKFSPFPEEINRSLTGRLADIHFAPTEGNFKNLLREGIDEKTIYITGNTVIDAFKEVIEKDYKFEDKKLNNIDYINKKIILLTSHRRENLGKPMENIFSAIKEIIEENKDVEVVFPIHLNPKVREIAYKYLLNNDRIHLVEPLDYKPFANLIAKSYLVLTDSGGIQEEAPSIGKPVLVLREETERPEAVEAGTVKVVGTKKEAIIKETKLLLNNNEKYQEMANAANPYGDGFAAKRIVDILEKNYKN